jgi:hypothetical protein
MWDMSTHGLTRHLPFKARALACVFIATFFVHAQQPSSAYGHNLDGQPVTRLADPDTQAVVLFFVASDCPISNRYFPELQRLESKFAAQHIAFWFVYPNAGEAPETVRQHQAAFGSEPHTLLDLHQRLVALTRVKVTPESAILVPEHANTEVLRTVYHGRIDDRYLDIGKERPVATRHDLERAILEVLQHRAVQPPDASAVGCGIVGQP